MNRFGARCLEALLKEGKSIDQVITLQDANSGTISDFQDLQPIGEKYNIPISRVKHINDLESDFVATPANTIFVVGWSQLISPTILSATKRGCVGTHPSLLPKNRGRAAIPWHILNQEKYGGLSLFYLQPTVDSGKIIAQKRFKLRSNETASSYYDKLCDIGPQLLVAHFDAIVSGNVKGKTQKESAASYLLVRRKIDSKLLFTQPSEVCERLIRAVATIYPLAFFVYKEKEYQVLTGKVITSPKISGRPGQVARVFTDKIWVVTSNSVIELGLKLESTPATEIFREGVQLNA